MRTTITRLPGPIGGAAVFPSAQKRVGLEGQGPVAYEVLLLMIIVMISSSITCYHHYDLYSYVWNILTAAISSTTVAISAVVMCTMAFTTTITTPIISTVGRLQRNPKP